MLNALKPAWSVSCVGGHARPRPGVSDLLRPARLSACRITRVVRRSSDLGKPWSSHIISQNASDKYNWLRRTTPGGVCECKGDTCYGARRVLFRALLSLAGRSFFDSPGFGLACSSTRETDLALTTIKHQQSRSSVSCAVGNARPRPDVSGYDRQARLRSARITMRRAP